MRPATRCLTTATALLCLLPLVAGATNTPPAGVVPIADVRDHGKAGDYLVIEGVVVAQKNDTTFEIEDATGRMSVAIPGYLISRAGAPAQNEKIRVAGKFDHAKNVPQLRVQTLWRDKADESARSDAPAPAAPATRTPSDGPKAAAAPARTSGPKASAEPSVFGATADDATVEKLTRARREWLDSIAELETASGEYARALYAAGDDGHVDPAIVARNNAAEDRVAAVSRQIPLLVDEARRAGVSEDVLRLYVQGTTGFR